MDPFSCPFWTWRIVVWQSPIPTWKTIIVPHPSYLLNSFAFITNPFEYHFLCPKCTLMRPHRFPIRSASNWFCDLLWALSSLLYIICKHSGQQVFQLMWCDQWLLLPEEHWTSDACCSVMCSGVFPAEKDSKHNGSPFHRRNYRVVVEFSTAETTNQWRVRLPHTSPCTQT